jgi:hypothetical protein
VLVLGTPAGDTAAGESKSGAPGFDEHAFGGTVAVAVAEFGAGAADEVAGGWECVTGGVWMGSMGGIGGVIFPD